MKDSTIAIVYGTLSILGIVGLCLISSMDVSTPDAMALAALSVSPSTGFMIGACVANRYRTKPLLLNARGFPF